ncbi:hypothetical protein SAMN04489867_0128 [Pedococcus dokdonensis]|uniref:Uncharacterized protein n=1 Tax=Pedococcus dokdonensis TaxID=443156 RepID=A0A1H0KWH1_9MICO|nr:hypothetical protein [Pedococcus dokdonensis]SDO60288.1 hypothetical protein SAMN04489867_0128 [Pedococcus dokdonensis]
MARHRGKARRFAVISGGALLVVALGVGGAYAAMTGGMARPPAAAGSSTTSSPSASSSSSSSSTTPASTGTPSGQASTGTSSTPGSASSSTTSANADATAAAALATCVTTVRAQQSLATAAAASARDWRLHTDAQRKFDSGTFTVQQTKAQWAASKARGPADLAAWTRAVAAVDRVKGGCAGLATATAGSPAEGAAKKCTARTAALSKVAAAGAVVHRQWAAHLTMMAHKEHTAEAAYLERWAAMVEDAGPALATYRGAAAALARAPACATVPSG